MNRGSKDIALKLTFLEVISSSFSNRAAEVDLFSCVKQEKKNLKNGESGHRSRYLSHAKRALYHVS